MTDGKSLARAALAQTRANTCNHGVKLDHCATCTAARAALDAARRAAETTETEGDE